MSQTNGWGGHFPLILSYGARTMKIMACEIDWVEFKVP